MYSLCHSSCGIQRTLYDNSYETIYHIWHKIGSLCFLVMLIINCHFEKINLLTYCKKGTAARIKSDFISHLKYKH